MPALVLSTILERFQAVLEASPLYLTASVDPFSDVAMPNTLVDTAFRLTAGGMVSSRSTSNYQAVRIDRVTVTVQQALKFSGYAAQADLQDLMDAIERALIADGPDQGYSVTVEKGSRKVERPKGADICRASLNLLVDYDFSEA
jgi:hypothetical protein